jgi:A/G-specific adenine glycosylase
MPVRECFLLVLRDPGQRVWLETRPPAGIWGGLKCLPEFAALDDLKAWCLPRRIDLDKLKLMAQRRHTFSHFHLDFVPVLAATVSLDSLGEQQNAGWFRPGEEAGLPTPVRKLLAELASP